MRQQLAFSGCWPTWKPNRVAPSGRLRRSRRGRQTAESEWSGGRAASVAAGERVRGWGGVAPGLASDDAGQGIARDTEISSQAVFSSQPLVTPGVLEPGNRAGDIGSGLPAGHVLGISQ